MNDTLRYLAEEPINRRYHHGELTFSLVYAFSEQYVLPLSHDEVVHGKGSLLRKMPGDRWQQLAGLRALFAYMWTHPGKNLIFMGDEFGQETEWAESRSLEWEQGDSPEHAGVRRLVRDLNHFYVEHPALWADDFSHAGFQWLEAGDGDHNTISYLRLGGGETVAVVVNFAGVPHEDYRVALPHGGDWLEALNTDAADYGGSGVGNLGRVRAEPVPWAGRSHSAVLRVPPLGAVPPVPAGDAEAGADLPGGRGARAGPRHRDREGAPPLERRRVVGLGQQEQLDETRPHGLTVVARRRADGGQQPGVGGGRLPGAHLDVGGPQLGLDVAGGGVARGRQRGGRVDALQAAEQLDLREHRLRLGVAGVLADRDVERRGGVVDRAVLQRVVGGAQVLRDRRRP